MFVAMQGLFIIYIASYDLLKPYKPTRKFVCIKLIVIIAALQKLVIEAAVPHKLSFGHYDSNALISMWQSCLLALESVAFSILMIYAFPVHELLKHHLGDPEKGVWTDEHDSDKEDKETLLQKGNPLSNQE